MGIDVSKITQKISTIKTNIATKLTSENISKVKNKISSSKVAKEMDKLASLGKSQIKTVSKSTKIEKITESAKGAAEAVKKSASNWKAKGSDKVEKITENLKDKAGAIKKAASRWKHTK